MRLTKSIALDPYEDNAVPTLEHWIKSVLDHQWNPENELAMEFGYRCGGPCAAAIQFAADSDHWTLYIIAKDLRNPDSYSLLRYFPVGGQTQISRDLYQSTSETTFQRLMTVLQ